MRRKKGEIKTPIVSRLVILFTSRMSRMFDENKYLLNEQNDYDRDSDDEDSDYNAANEYNSYVRV